MEKKKLKTISAEVKELLQKYPRARDDDMLLYSYYMNLKGYSWNITVSELYYLQKEGNLPTFESIGRARRKVQELNPDLAPSKKAKELKDINEEEYEEFSKETEV